MQVSQQQLSEEANFVNKASQESLNVNDIDRSVTVTGQDKPTNSSGYWKEGWESQIAALKVELAQLRFENESLSLQLRNLQNLQGKLQTSGFVQTEDSSERKSPNVGISLFNKTSQNAEHENFMGSHFWNKKKPVKKKSREDIQPERSSFESVSEEKETSLEKEMFSNEITVDVLRTSNQGQDQGVQGTLSLCHDLLVFRPLDSEVVFQKLSFSKRVLKDANISVPLGFIHVCEKQDITFVGLQSPMESLYFSTQQLHSRFRTLQTGNSLSHFTPKLLQNSAILRSNDLILLSLCMPRRYQNCDWSLLYSTNDHGISIHTFYSRVSEKSPTLLLIKNTDGDCFGCYASQPWKPCLHYYGTGECFVFTLSPEYHVYRWSSENHSFQLSSMDFLAIGGGKHFAIWIDSDFVSGSSGECDTFHSPTLCSYREFTCHILEAWYPISN
ncbi:Oxidation resistance protein 1 [Galdieria sulphuraria]|nr:Oxidation resistance protein 1 [Galdieria sulphuraria]